MAFCASLWLLVSCSGRAFPSAPRVLLPWELFPMRFVSPLLWGCCSGHVSFSASRPGTLWGLALPVACPPSVPCTAGRLTVPTVLAGSMSRASISLGTSLLGRLGRGAGRVWPSLCALPDTQSPTPLRPRSEGTCQFLLPLRRSLLLRVPWCRQGRRRRHALLGTASLLLRPPTPILRRERLQLKALWCRVLAVGGSTHRGSSRSERAVAVAPTKVSSPARRPCRA